MGIELYWIGVAYEFTMGCGMLYRGLEREALDTAYDNTNAVEIEKRNTYISDLVTRSKLVN